MMVSDAGEGSEEQGSDDVFRRDGGPFGRTSSSSLVRLRRDADVLLAIALGGGLGSLVRYAVATLIPPRGGFPWSTFLVNGVGCLLIGVLMVFVADVWRAGRYGRPFLAIGFLGGLTTYSTFMLELRMLGAESDMLVASGYLAATLVAGLAGVWVGTVGTRAALGGPRVRRSHGESEEEAG